MGGRAKRTNRPALVIKCFVLQAMQSRPAELPNPMNKNAPKWGNMR